MMMKRALLAALMTISTAALANPASSTVSFSNGNEGWYGPDKSGGIDNSLGSDAIRLVNEDFGFTFGTNSNAAFLGDYTQYSSVTLGIDVSLQTYQYLGAEVPRNLMLELRDYDVTPEGSPYTSVFVKLGEVSAGQAGWRHFEVTFDPTSSVLPDGWQGYNANSVGLPAGSSFASVLSGVDEVVFTSMEPYYFYGFAIMDVAVDNISISAVPEPASGAMLLAGLGLIGACVQRKRRAGAGAAKGAASGAAAGA